MQFRIIETTEWVVEAPDPLAAEIQAQEAGDGEAVREVVAEPQS